MANDLNSISYGYTPGETPLGAAMAGQEDAYVKARRDRDEQALREEAARKAAHDAALADYYKSQAGMARDSMLARQETAKENSVLKQAQADVLRKQQARPIVDQILALTDKGQKGDMGALVQAARMHKMLEQQFPDYAKLIPQQNRFVDKNTGQDVESGYNPETFAAGAQNWPRDPGYVKTEVQGMKNEGAANVANINGATARDVASINRQARIEAMRAAGAGKKDTVNNLLAEAEKRYLASGNDEDYTTVQHLSQLLQSIKPTPMATTVRPDGSIGPAPANAPTDVPKLPQKNPQPAAPAPKGLPQGMTKEIWKANAKELNPHLSDAQLEQIGRSKGYW